MAGEEHSMSSMAYWPKPVGPERPGRLRRIRHAMLAIIILSGPAIFTAAAVRSYATSDANACQQARSLETPWDFAATKVKLTLDRSLTGDGLPGVAAGRDARELIAVTADQQRIRLHSASWPVQSRPDAELFLYSPNEVIDRIMDYSAANRRDRPILVDELSLDLYRAQWIARESAFDWDRPWEDGKLFPLGYKVDEAVARQLAVWRVVDGLAIATYDQYIDPEIARRADDLVDLSAYYAPEQGELDQGSASLGASSTRSRGQVVISADVATSDGTPLPHQTLTFDYPGGRVLALTDSAGKVCMSLPETIGETAPTVAVRWERYIPAGSYFAALSTDSVPVDDASQAMDESRALPDRRFVGITLNSFRVADQLTLSLPPRE